LREVNKQKAEAAAKRRMRSRLEFEAANPDYNFAESRADHFERLRHTEYEKLKETREAREAQEIEDRGLAANAEAARSLARTVPRTAAQALALLSFIRECEDAGDDITMTYNEDDAPAFMDILGSLEAFLRTQLN